MEDRLVIGFADGHKDIPTIAVLREYHTVENGDAISKCDFLNYIQGDEARVIYERLIKPKNRKVD